MTLRRQLLLGISFIFLLIYLGLLGLSVTSSRAYLQQQLASHAQDAASTLAPLVSQALGTADQTKAETQVAALFDRGYFQRILVLNTRGEPLVVRELPERIEGVPLWFTRLASINTDPGEAFLGIGWKQLGKVIVVSQPTLAYQHLWRSTLESAGWMLGAFIISIFLTHLFLQLILNPLRRIEQATHDICERHFVQITEIPRAKELRSVVEAMNDASRRISYMLDAETRRAQQFRQEAYEDALTHMENRRGFDLRLGQILGNPEHLTAAYIAVLEIDGLREFNLVEGYHGGNRLLAALADLARCELSGLCVLMARIGGGSLAFVCLNHPERAFRACLESFLKATPGLDAARGSDAQLTYCVGLTSFGDEEKAPAIMARADLAVETARQNGGDRIESLAPDETAITPMGSHNWRVAIENALRSGHWALLAQPAVRLDGQGTLHHEMMGRLVDSQGNLVQASYFMPMAQRHNFIVDIDQAFIELCFRLLDAPAGEITNVAINVSSESIANPAFLAWLEYNLQKLGAKAHHLSFELSELGATNNLDATEAFKRLLARYKVQFGMDRFGLDPVSLNTLRRVLPDYIKLDGGLVMELADNNDARQIFSSILQLAHSLDVTTIALHVEDEAVADSLRAQGVQGAQGYLYGRPERV
jgi:EAL domain-containing protein (putative c-di-GMP-specific phosphodiesterase class I)/GGDEF domain-containing protein